MRKNSCLILCILILLSLTLPVSASENNPLIVDRADLLSAQEELLLEQSADSLRQQYSMDIVILTTDSMGGLSAWDYAEGFYNSNGYGNHGVIFLLSMQEREWYIATCGNAIYALTDYGISLLGEEMVPYLSEGSYFEAFQTYLNALPYYLDAYEKGTPIDGYADYSGDYYHVEQEEVIYYEKSSGPNYLISVGVGLAVAAIAVLAMRSSMNSKRPQRSAASYLKSGSYHLRTHRDLFLYSNSSKIRRQENSNSHGGGSSIHRSSGGRKFGGGGGKF